MEKFKILALAMTLVMLIGTTSTFACSAVYVGKDVSTDRSTIIARSEDQGTGAYNKLFVVVPRVEGKPGRTHDDIQGFSYPLPPTTFKYTMIPDNNEGDDGVYAGGATNEYGLTISATVSASPNEAAEKADPFVEGGLRESSLTGLLASICKTPKEAIDKLSEIIEKYGSEEGNIIFLANKEEAWLFEVYTGHLWAAQKMPTDKVAMFGNQFMIGEVDPADTKNFMFQKDLFKKADEFKLTKKTNGKVNLALTFGEPREDYSNMRTWMGHKIMSPSTVGDYKTDERYPLFYAPDKKVSALEVMDILRNRYEGTRLDASLPENKDLRVIGVERQSQIHVFQLKDKYPENWGAIQWLAFGNAEHSIFIPNFPILNDTHSSYKVEKNRYNEDGAYWKYKRICALAEQNRAFYGQGVKDFWKLYETGLYADMQAEEDKVIAMYKKDKAAAEKYATDLQAKYAVKYNALADHLYNDLLFFVMDRNGRTAKKLGGPFVAEMPIRDAASLKGYTLEYKDTKSPIVLKKADTAYSFTIGSDKALVTKAGKTNEIELSFAPVVDNYVTYIPADIVKVM